MKRLVSTCFLLAALSFAPAALAGGPTMVVGAAEDNVRQPTLMAAKVQMDLLRLLGLNAVRVSSIWAPGSRAPSEGELATLANISGAAKLDGVRVYVQVTNAGSRTTPLADADQADFAAYASALATAAHITHFIVGNEPNLNRFWLPQYTADGSDAAAPAYTSLLARTYDALKAVSPRIEVWGASVSPRGEDKAGSTRPTHSPTAFIADMGIAYRASGRATPIMDGLALHPYEDYSSLPPSFQHPNTSTIALADYGKLVAILKLAFDGTAQPGSQLPVLYDEFGVEAQIPPGKTALYTGTELQATRPVDEATQGTYYHDALALAYCQPNVRGFFFFHTVDEQALDRWQSGLYYVDGAQKSDFAAVQTAVRDSRAGVIARCPGLQLTPTVAILRPIAPSSGPGEFAFQLRCNLDCSYVARLERLPGHNTIAEKRGSTHAFELVPVSFGTRGLRPGLYRFTARAFTPVNVGPPGRTFSRVLRIGP